MNSIAEGGSPVDNWAMMDDNAGLVTVAKHSVHWFRKDLRLHDNASLLAGARQASSVRCVFILDYCIERQSKYSTSVSNNKWRFLLDSLRDLDESLRRLGSRLLVARGQPLEVFRRLLPQWGCTHLSFEEDCTPLGRERDASVTRLAHELGITVLRGYTQTLYSQEALMQSAGGSLPLTFAKFHQLLAAVGPPSLPCPSLQDEMASLPPPQLFQPNQQQQSPMPFNSQHFGSRRKPSYRTYSAQKSRTDYYSNLIDEDSFNVPTLTELGIETQQQQQQPKPVLIRGGETEALARLSRHIERRSWVATYGERPRYQTQLLMPSGTCLSAHLAFGCLSPKLVYAQLTDLYRKLKGPGIVSPPLHIYGELLWREYLYLTAYDNPNFDRIASNPMCLPIPWRRDQPLLDAWSNGQTGVPWIDAIMAQIRLEGWTHTYCRYSAVAFLTRGHLFQTWEDGAKLFDQLLIDSEWPTNNGLWLWMSGSAFFQQFSCTYSPVAAGKKLDPQGDFIRHYLPRLSRLPIRYLHEPWLAPLAVQEAACCLLGRDYPNPLIPDLDAAARDCATRLRATYAALLAQAAQPASVAASAAAAASARAIPPSLTPRPQSQQQQQQQFSFLDRPNLLDDDHFVLDMLASPSNDEDDVSLVG